MTFYIIIFLLSIGGVIAILIRNRREFAEFNFATFMEGVEEQIVLEWQNNFKPKSLLFLEKKLRGVRIWALKAENLLLRATRRIRGIYENGNPPTPARSDDSTAAAGENSHSGGNKLPE